MVENFKNRDLNVVVFKDGELQLDVSVCPEENTVWLIREDISYTIHFKVKKRTVLKFIKLETTENYPVVRKVG